MILLHRLRRSRAARNAAASYLAFASSTLCTLVSIPLAVAFLDAPRIGLWLLISQWVSFLVWLDFGVGEAVGRKIAGPLSRGDVNEINSWWSLSIAVLSVLGFVVLILGGFLWPIWLMWFRIEGHLLADAKWLYAASVLATALSLPIRAIPGLLIARQRFVWVPVSQILTSLVQMGVFALGLGAGLGVKSFFWGVFAGSVAGWVVMIAAFRTDSHRPRFSISGWERSRVFDLFSFSTSIAMAGLAQAFTRSLPAVLLGRLAGLSTVSSYAYTARFPEVLANLTQRTSLAFHPSIQADCVAGDLERFSRRYREVQNLTLAIGLICAAIVLLGNRTVICWLASPSFHAGSTVGLWFAVAAISIPYAAHLQQLLQHSGRMGKAALIAVTGPLLGIGFGLMAYRSHGVAGIAGVFALIPWLPASAYAVFRGCQNLGIKSIHLCGPGFGRFAASVVLVIVFGGLVAGGGNPATSEFLGRPLVLPSLAEIAASCVVGAVGCTFAFRSLCSLYRYSG